MMRALLVFLDGLGLGDDGPANPVGHARLPTFRDLIGHAPLRRVAPAHGEAASLVAADATLGVPGTPQSGTGQATLLTGEDMVRRFGRHHGPWVPTALRPLVARGSLLARARESGRSVAFANAYPEELLGRLPEAPFETQLLSRRLGPLRSGPPLAALGAGALRRSTPELAAGTAVASEITNDGWIERLGRTGLPRPTPAEAGASLAAIAARHDLTLFAHYTTDLVGHRGTFAEAVAALERVDAFLGGLLRDLPAATRLVIASDHGNIEDATREHTRNPALVLVAGPGHQPAAERVRDLRDVAGLLLDPSLP